MMKKLIFLLITITALSSEARPTDCELSQGQVIHLTPTSQLHVSEVKKGIFFTWLNDKGVENSTVWNCKSEKRESCFSLRMALNLTLLNIKPEGEMFIKEFQGEAICLDIALSEKKFDFYSESSFKWR
jgi:hypothetical protein